MKNNDVLLMTRLELTSVPGGMLTPSGPDCCPGFPERALIFLCQF